MRHPQAGFSSRRAKNVIFARAALPGLTMMKMRKEIYLDYAAATPVDPLVVAAMTPYFSEKFYNPSALYLSARSARADLEAARALVAKELGARPAEIIFTAGGSEANNLAIHGVMAANPGKNLLISAIEHESVRVVSEKYNCQEIDVNEKGMIDLTDLRKKINDDTALISVIYASNEVGTIEPIAEIGALVSEINRDRRQRKIILPLLFHTDAAQAANYLSLNPTRLGVDLMSINGGKIYGPKASGALYVAGGLKLEPIIYGGGQESGLRSGTENVASSVGFAEALKIARKKSKAEAERLTKLRDELKDQLQSNIPGVIFHGHSQKRLPNNLSFAIPNFDNETLMMELDERGYMVATGSACSARKVEASHVLKSMGVSDDLARSTLRVSLGRGTTRKQLEAFALELAKLAGK